MQIAYAKPAEIAAPPALSLRLNFAWTSVGTVIYSACQWAVLSVLAKLGTPAVVGQYALGLAVATPVLMLAQLNLRAVLATDVRNEHPFRDYLNLRLLTTAAGLLIIGAISIVGGYRRELALVIVAVGILQAIDGVSDICFGWQQQHERMKRIAISMAVRGVLGTLAMGVGVAVTGQLLWGVLAGAAARLTILLGFDLRCVPSDRDWRFLSSFGRQMRVLWISLPLGVVLMLNSLVTSAPRYWIERQQGEHMLGIFSAIASLMVVGSTIINALGQSATPRLAKLYESGDLRSFYSLVGKLAGLGLGVGVAGILVAATVGRLTLQLVYRPEYALHNDLLVAMMGVGAIAYLGSLLGYAITATRTFRAQVPLFVAVAAATVAGSVFLIPRYGLQGAALSVGIASVVQVAGEVAILWRAGKREIA